MFSTTLFFYFFLIFQFHSSAVTKEKNWAHFSVIIFFLWFKFLFVLCSNKKQNRIASLTAADLKMGGYGISFSAGKINAKKNTHFRRQNITYCNSSLSIDSFRLHLVECFVAGPFLRSSEVFLLQNIKIYVHEPLPLALDIHQKNSPIAKNISLTLTAVFADVSIKSKPFSSAYCFASSKSTARLADKSALLPASAITMFGEALNIRWEEKKLVNWNCQKPKKPDRTSLTCRWSSFTHVWARTKLSWFWMSYTTIAACAPR